MIYVYGILSAPLGVSNNLRCVFKPTRQVNFAATKPRRLRLETTLAAAVIMLFALQAPAQAPTNTQTHPANTLSTFPPATSTAPVDHATTLLATATATPSADQSHYLISPGDVLDVSVFGAPDLSQRVVVNSAGSVYMPLINYVHIAGMHAEDAQSVVENAYLGNGVLKSPHVNIVITSYSSGVVLMGEVAKPGIYPIVGSGKLFDILAEAGGTTVSAGQTVTVTHRGGTETQSVMLTSDPEKSLAADVPVQQGDTIIVSKAGVVYVVGEVLSPSGFLMDEKDKYTVMKVVAMAHGTTKLAKASNARIVRRTPEGEKVIPVPLDKILISKAPDIPMQSNDILFVPTNKGKMAAARTVEVAISLASSAAYVAMTHTY
jgi:polysaccharide export outer membrane protein